MYLQLEEKSNVLIAHMTGELDHHSAEEVRNKIDNILDMDKINKLIMDFSGVTFMDSSGIGVVIGRYRKLLMKKGQISITNLCDSVKKVFELSGMFKIIKVYSTIDDAINNM